MSEKEREDIFQVIGHPVLILNPDYTIADVNKTAIEAIGLSKEELRNKKCYEIFHNVEKPPNKCPMKKSLDTTGIETEEMEVEALGGVYLVSCTPILNEEGNPEKVIHMATDITEKKETERKLRQKQYHLKKAQEIGKIGTWELDTENNELVWTDEVYRIFGVPSTTELTYDDFLERVHPEDRAYVNEAWKAALQGEPYDIDHRIIVGDKVKWVREKAELEFDEEGNVIRGVGAVQDITERKKAEEALKESERRFRSFINSTSDSVFLKDENFKHIFVNDVYAEFLGRKKEEIIGKTDFELLPEELATQCRKSDKKALEREETIISEEKGKRRVYESRKFPVLLKEGKIGVGGILRDITSKKEMENALYRKSTILEAVNIGIERILNTKRWQKEINAVLKHLREAVNVDRVYIFKNHRSETGELLTSQLYEQTGPGIEPQIDNPELQNFSWEASGFTRWVNVLSGKGTIEGHIKTFPKPEQVVLRSQQIKSILVVPIFVNSKWWGFMGFDECKKERNWSEEEIGALKIAANSIGEAIQRKKIEQQRRKSRKEAEFYADVLAHDIGNINQVMMGYLYLIEHTENAETREENIRNMKKSIRKCKRLAENIQILKKINKEPQKTLEISTCIKKAVNNLKEDSDQEIKLNFDISSEIHVTANSFLDEAFFNILENAAGYTVQEPVQIDISIEEKDSMCEVCIRDYGLGISEEKRKDLLENLDTLSKRTGMGLFLSKRIIESSNGVMDIVSREKGTEVVITLPIEKKNNTMS